ncbi:MAG: phosphatidylserine decarboxylase [Alphaproteobacteria bacterium]
MKMIDVVAVPMHKEGRKFVGIFAAITIILALIWAPLFWPGLGLTIWCYYFFRDPVRSVPQNTNLMVSPADGVVSLISEMLPPAELDLGTEPRIRVSVFMNVFNCHVNRVPIGGKIVNISYHEGKFLNASLDKASEHNERNSLTIEYAPNEKIGVVQIAGLVARRILCEVEEGTELATGERFGLIRFGSRLDIYLPPKVQPMVHIGTTCTAGETLLADLSDPSTKHTCKRI